MEDSIIKSLWDYFLACPLMADRKINVDFLPEKGVEYSIDTTPATQIVKYFVDGTSIRQYLFVIRSVEEYLKGLHHFEEILITRAGGVISSHCGPGTLGVLFYEKG